MEPPRPRFARCPDRGAAGPRRSERGARPSGYARGWVSEARPERRRRERLARGRRGWVSRRAICRWRRRRGAGRHGVRGRRGNGVGACAVGARRRRGARGAGGEKGRSRCARRAWVWETDTEGARRGTPGRRRQPGHGDARGRRAGGHDQRFASVPAQETLEAGTVLTLDAHGSALPHAMHALRGGPASMLNPPEPCQESMSRASSSSSRPWVRKYRSTRR
jgi:hypothetical protein